MIVAPTKAPTEIHDLSLRFALSGLRLRPAHALLRSATFRPIGAGSSRFRVAPSASSQTRKGPTSLLGSNRREQESWDAEIDVQVVPPQRGARRVDLHLSEL